MQTIILNMFVHWVFKVVLYWVMTIILQSETAYMSRLWKLLLNFLLFFGRWAIFVKSDFPLSDGQSVNLFEQVVQDLAKGLRQTLPSIEPDGVGWNSLALYFDLAVFSYHVKPEISLISFAVDMDQLPVVKSGLVTNNSIQLAFSITSFVFFLKHDLG